MFILLSSFFLLIPSLTVSAENAAYDIEQYVADMQPGWNLGNTFDSEGTNETAWGNPFVTKELIDAIADQGYNSIRIPITFEHRTDPENEHLIDSDFLRRVTDAVDWSLAAGMKVMINIHHDSWLWLETGMVDDYDQTVARYEAIWKQLAEHFKDYNIDLMFESINEARFATRGNDNESLNYLDDLNDRFFKIVRESGGKNQIRPIVIPTLLTATDQNYLDRLSNWLDTKNDPYAIATIHYYGFWPFSVNIAGHTTFDQETVNELHDTFDRVHEQFTQNGIPVVVGEFGLLGFDQNVHTIQQGEKLKFFEYLIHYAKEKDFVHILWDNGQHFDRHNYEWQDQELFNMISASFSGRSATAERDFIFFKQTEEITDQELGLNLNGRTLERILHDGAEVEESAYSVADQTLTLSTDLLTELVNLDKFGKSDQVILEFDQGASWRVDLIVYDTPEVHQTEGNYRHFKIPTDFNGDRLATLEAFYENGSGVGPQNWTTFKEFAEVFSPNYENETIDFTFNPSENQSPLFDDMRQDEPVKLKLHFWSGAILDYEVMKSGDQVIGSLDGVAEGEDDTEHDQDVEADENTENSEDVASDDTEAQQEGTRLPDDSPSFSIYHLAIGFILLMIGGIIIYTVKRKQK